ncbi:MAG: NTP transferase domain-containing protein [Actinomycetia bacterium]|nr:NTP transferase domain-containing protein [Actinomycetes bacterium]
MTTAGVVLAAGEGRRFEGPTHKLRAPFRGRCLAAWALEAAAAAGLDELIVVTGAVDLDDLIPAGATVVRNENWADGQAGSLRGAVFLAESRGHDAVVVGLADQPLVPAEAWRAVGASSSPIAIADFDGDRRPPTRLAKEVWSLLPVSGDEGARRVLRARPDLVEAIPCSGSPVDIDTVEDLRIWS